MYQLKRHAPESRLSVKQNRHHKLRLSRSIKQYLAHVHKRLPSLQRPFPTAAADTPLFHSPPNCVSLLPVAGPTRTAADCRTPPGTFSLMLLCWPHPCSWLLAGPPLKDPAVAIHAMRSTVSDLRPNQGPAPVGRCPGATLSLAHRLPASHRPSSPWIGHWRACRKRLPPTAIISKERLIAGGDNKEHAGVQGSRWCRRT